MNDFVIKERKKKVQTSEFSSSFLPSSLLIII